ncbi:hypothetical protein M2401_006866 [Pseudomonas sp. JUb42]|uniref:DUF6555 family protein n=1 Tax=Pseudomonas sp. JUb42 TaxID=2940611 RepID=UPI0021690F76|nr:DUF6555 family protein [Pseudomonas sp. JUb42]MCS3473098.1 hypothetical protein [Pseudomonas sp. JUb42]
MANDQHFRIDYLLHGAYKTFYLRAPTMSNADAWNWAAIDAGVAQLPKYRTNVINKLRKPQAEMHGIANVQWSKA